MAECSAVTTHWCTKVTGGSYGRSRSRLRMRAGTGAVGNRVPEPRFASSWILTGRRATRVLIADWTGRAARQLVLDRRGHPGTPGRRSFEGSADLGLEPKATTE